MYMFPDDTFNALSAISFFVATLARQTDPTKYCWKFTIPLLSYKTQNIHERDRVERIIRLDKVRKSKTWLSPAIQA